MHMYVTIKTYKMQDTQKWQGSPKYVQELALIPIESPYDFAYRTRACLRGCVKGLLIRYYQIFRISQYYKITQIHKTIIKCNMVRKYKRHLIFTWKPSTRKNHGLVSAPHSNLESTICDSVYNLIPVDGLIPVNIPLPLPACLLQRIQSNLLM